jgi:DNA-binding NarL/FixJ family response regulator
MLLQLSAREREVLQLLARGMTNREIGRQLYISAYTVKEHVSNILIKLQATDRTQAAVLGLQLGYVPLRESPVFRN